EAQLKGREASQKANDVLSLSAQRDLDELVARADRLWPAYPQMVPEYESWIAEARELIDGRPADDARGIKRRPSLAQYEAKLAEIRSRGRPPARDGARADGMAPVSPALEFDDGEDRWWYAQLSTLVSDLRALTNEDQGGLLTAGVSDAHGWGIEKRLALA